MTGADDVSLPPGVPQLRVLGKVVRVMDAFTGDRTSLSMAELAQKTGLPTTTVGRIVHNLVALRVLEQEDRQFRVGFAAVAWAASALQGKGIVDNARDVLRRLRDATGETSFLVVRTGTSRMCVAVEESTTPIRHTVDLGYRVPLHVGSTGWVFLAFDEHFSGLSLEQMVQYWSDVPVDELQAVLHEVRTARAAGYAVSVNSSGIGASGISVPVLDGANAMLAAIGVTGPCQRVTMETIEGTLRPLVLDAAAELAKRLELVPRRG